jgi:hypothetical protein
VCGGSVQACGSRIRHCNGGTRAVRPQSCLLCCLLHSRRRAAAAAPGNSCGRSNVMQKCDAVLQAASAVAPLIQGISSKADVSSSAGDSSSSRAALFQSIHSEVTRTFATSRAKVQLYISCIYIIHLSSVVPIGLRAYDTSPPCRRYSPVFFMPLDPVPAVTWRRHGVADGRSCCRCGCCFVVLCS